MWITHFERLARQPNRTPHHLTTLWMNASWKLCIDMRSGDSLDKAATALQQDSAWWHEQYRAMAQQPLPQQPYTPRGQGKGKKRTFSSSPGGQTPNQKIPKGERLKAIKTSLGWEKPRSEQEKCKKFNLGTCQRDDCQYAHSCSTCNKPGHGASTCWWNEDKAPKEQKGGKAKGKGKGKKGKKGKSSE